MSGTDSPQHIASPQFFVTGLSRVPVLDLLRSAAILLVMLRHFATKNPQYHEYIPLPILNTMLFGWTGVDLFFVLSGFLIGGKLIEATASPSFSLARFYTSRALRIVPAYYFSLVVVIVIVLMGSASARDFFDVNDYMLFHLLFLQNFFIGSSPNGGVYWSLAVEEQFYLFLPIFLLWVRLLRDKYLSRFILAWICFPLLYRVLRFTLQEVGFHELYSYFYHPFYSRADSLGIGVLCAMIHGGYSTHGNAIKYIFSLFRRRSVLFFLTVITGVAAYISTRGLSGVPQMPAASAVTAGFTLVAAFYGLLMLFLLQVQPKLSPALWEIINVGAHLSYSGYLYHILVRDQIQNLLVSIESMGIQVPVGILLPLHLAVFILLSFAAAFLSYAFVERPFLLLKRRIT